MKTEWKKVRLGEICDYVTSGGTPLASRNDYYNPPVIPWLKTKEVNYSRITKTENFISQKGLDNSSAKLIPENSVIIAMYGQGDTAGRVAINKIPLTTNQACCNFIIDKEKADYNFIYYQLCTLYDKMVSLKSGGAQPNLNAGKLKELEIFLPSLETQQKIAEILSAYDDLIENNRKQIKLLEEAAQKLYKEWFVKLNFPGHENVKIVDGVPEGWKILTIEELLSEHFNGGWGKETLTGNFKNSGFVIRGTDINDIEQGQFSDIPYRYHSDKDIKTKSIREGDIIFELSNGNINNIGRTLLVTNELLVTLEAPVICASFCKLFRPKNLNYSILLKREIEDMQISKRLLPYKKNGANGINNFAFNDFLNHKLLIPEANSKLYSYLEKYEKAKTQIQKRLFLLQSARDELLPKLMNGEYV